MKEKTGDTCMSQLFEQAGLTDTQIRHLARKLGAWKRFRTIQPEDVVKHMCQAACYGTVSYRDLAVAVAVSTNRQACRQAYAKHMNPGLLALIMALVEAAMQEKVSPGALPPKEKLKGFRRILLQDSTVIKLPTRLFDIYSGVRNGHTAVCNARVQAIYDLCAGKFILFRIDPYSRNDAAATHDLVAQPGDLILRDRGYFVVDAVQAQTEAGAATINRYKARTPLYDPATGEPIDLLELLVRNGRCDMDVLVGAERKLRARLVAVPASEEVANLRRMKAKRENNSPPSENVLKLMSWTIMLATNLPAAISADETIRLYSLRWRIENIFKAWKSNFSFSKLHNVARLQFQCLIYSRLLTITMLFRDVFSPLARLCKRKTGRELSLMAFMRHAVQHPELQVAYCSSSEDTAAIRNIFRYCTYGKRQRQNYIAALTSCCGLTGTSVP